MIKVSEIVRSILDQSEIASSALSSGILNLSAFAKNIQPEVEARAMKEVKVGTIVAALARYAGEFKQKPPFNPEVYLRDISVKSRLVEIAFDQSDENRKRTMALYQSPVFLSSDFLTLTHGVRELSIIVSETSVPEIMKIFKGTKPRLKLDKLCALTVRFDEHYIYEPGQTFSLVRKLAIKRINIVEIVSTYTELTFVLNDQDIEVAIAQFARELGRKHS